MDSYIEAVSLLVIEALILVKQQIFIKKIGLSLVEEKHRNGPVH